MFNATVPTNQSVTLQYMFKNFFTRAKAAANTPSVAPPTSVTVTMSERRQMSRPMPTVDVVESDCGETEWDAWIETEGNPLGPV